MRTFFLINVIITSLLFFFFGCVKQVPQKQSKYFHQEQKIYIPKDIDFTITAERSPDNKNVRQNFFAYNDVINISIIIRDSNFKPKSNDHFIAVIGHDGNDQIDINLKLSPGSTCLLKGCHSLSEKNIVLNDAPVNVFYIPNGQKYHLNRIATINIKTKIPETPRLYYKKRPNHVGAIDLIWSASAQDGIKYEIHRRSQNGNWKRIATLNNPGERKCQLPSFRWGNSYKVRVIDWAGNSVDSNAVTLNSYCDNAYDYFYMISKNAEANLSSFNRYVQDFERILKDSLSSCQTKNAYCAENVLNFQIYTEPTDMGYIIHVKDIETGNLFLNGQYIYPLSEAFWEMQAVDKRKLKKAIESRFPRENNHGVSQIVRIEGFQQISLSEANNICRDSGGRLLTPDEWFENQGSFENKNRIGEYVVGGMIYYNEDYYRWTFFEILQPQASNPYCVRCRME